MINLHMHSKFSDGCNSLFEMCEMAEALKLKQIAFVEHVMLNKPLSKFNALRKVKSYYKAIESARDQFKLKILFGFEIDYFKVEEKRIKKITDEYPLDIVLGACHFIKRKHVMDSSIMQAPALYRKYKPSGVYEMYFDKVIDAVNSGLFDVIAHLDVVRHYREDKIHSPVKFSKYKDKLLEVLSALKSNKQCIEFNIAEYSEKNTYPSVKFMKMCYDAGFRRVTIGTDAHNVSHVGKRLAWGWNTLKRIGFKRVCSFDKRKISYINL